MDAREVGVEEEFLLFRADEPVLADAGPRVVASAERRADDDAQFEKELKQAQAELATAPTESLTHLAEGLAARRAELAAAAAERGVRVVASGTCAVDTTTDTTAKRRYREMAERFAALEHAQLTCAMHVHVSVASDDEGVLVLNRAAPWWPLLAALASNSPFHAGRDTGYAGFRSLVWGQWPTAGPTGEFRNGADYRRTVRSLIGTGAARDEGMIYFDARLSANYPTVEIRVCDVCVDARDAVTIAGLCRAIVAKAAADDSAPTVRPELLRAASWRAARFGMGDTLADLRGDVGADPLVPAWQLADTLVDHVADELAAAGDLESVQRGLARIRRRGTGADVQRAAVERDGLAAAIDAVTVRPRR